MKRWLRAAARLYPKRWRDRYGAEFDALLEGTEPVRSDVFDVLRGAAMMQMRGMSQHLWTVILVALAGVLIALAAAYAGPRKYESTSVIRIAASGTDSLATEDNLRLATQDVLSRRSLSELIQRPVLDLYKSERAREPLEDIIANMNQKDIKIGISQDGNAELVHVSFVYRDPDKAQAVTNALTSKMLDARARIPFTREESLVVSPATLPQPLKPNLVAFLACGLGLSLIAGIVIAMFRWRAKWTLKLLACGLIGCVGAAAASLVISNQYVSRCFIRVVPVRSESQTAEWLQNKEKEVLTDQNLAEIIQKRRLALYTKEHQKEPIEAVIATMRRNLVVRVQGRSMIDISFKYPDRFIAQQVVAAVAAKFLNRGIEGGVVLLDAASLPETPVSPNRSLIVVAGLVLGLLAGGYWLRGRSMALTSA